MCSAASRVASTAAAACDVDIETVSARACAAGALLTADESAVPAEISKPEVGSRRTGKEVSVGLRISVPCPALAMPTRGDDFLTCCLPLYNRPSDPVSGGVFPLSD